MGDFDCFLQGPVFFIRLFEGPVAQDDRRYALQIQVCQGQRCKQTVAKRPAMAERKTCTTHRCRFLFISCHRQITAQPWGQAALTCKPHECNLFFLNAMRRWHLSIVTFHDTVCHSKKCHRPRTSSCHKEQRGGTARPQLSRRVWC